MVLNAIVLALVLAATFMQSSFGFYSGVLNVFCALVSVAVALGFFEPANVLISGHLGIPSAYSEPVAILALYLFSFAVLRTLTDNYLRRPVSVHPYVETAGSIACGFIVAQLTMGLMVITILLLPIGGQVLQFSRYVRAEERDRTNAYLATFERQSMWLRSDEMTLALFSMMSDGSLSGSTRFAEVYPDYTDAIFFSTNTVQMESSPTPRREKRQDGFKDGVSVIKWWHEPAPVEGRYRQEIPSRQQPLPPYRVERYTPAPGNRMLGVRVTLRPAAADKSGPVMVHMFRPTAIRLVGRVGEEPMHFTPRILGGADRQLEGARRIVDMDNNFSIPGSSDVEIDAIFEVPDGFTPDFIEYRRHARAAIRGEPVDDAPTEGPTLAPADRAAAAARGRALFNVLLDGYDSVTDRLPRKLAADAMRRAPNVKVESDRFASGRIFGAVPRFEPERGGAELAGFAVPEGMALLQIRYRPREAQTVVGDVLNYVARLNQYKAVDDRGDSYDLCGYYAVVRRGGEEFIELFYNGDPADPADPGFRSMLDFKDLKANEVNGEDSEIGLYFHVRRGRTILRIENQRGDGGDVRIRVP